MSEIIARLERRTCDGHCERVLILRLEIDAAPLRGRMKSYEIDEDREQAGDRSLIIVSIVFWGRDLGLDVNDEMGEVRVDDV